ncbi:MAG: hypothetical protein HYU39_02920 [Thaumarchaeota archaeon]|nr:hypothetical protein [Nitrososphaerota archaeon]
MMTPTIFSRSRALEQGKIVALSVLSVILLAYATLGQAYGASTSEPAQTISLTPNEGIPGTDLTVAGKGFKPLSNIELVWTGVKGEFKVKEEKFQGRVFTPDNQVLKSVTADNSGVFTANIQAPRDHGGLHNVEAKVVGENIKAVGSFKILPTFEITPLKGKSNTKITITGHGLPNGEFTSTWTVLYDNVLVGYGTGITTKGDVIMEIWGSGEPGVHRIEIIQGFTGTPYLNPQQSRNQNPIFRFDFTVEGDGVPDILKNPASYAVTGIALASVAAVVQVSSNGKQEKIKRGRILKASTAIAIILSLLGAAFTLLPISAEAQDKDIQIPQVTLPTSKGVSAVPQPSSSKTGPILSVTPEKGVVGSVAEITGKGFQPNTKVDLLWFRMVGDRTVTRGWSEKSIPVGSVVTTPEGTLTSSFTIPYDLGGPPHRVSAVTGKQTLANATYTIERNAVMTPTRGPPGTLVKLEITGIGWTEYDNIVTLNYDNAHLGYACGFQSQGNVTIYFRATGNPGTHKVDLYPAIYDGPYGGIAAPYRLTLLSINDHPTPFPVLHFEFTVTEGKDNLAYNPSLYSLLGFSTSVLAVGMTLVGNGKTVRRHAPD